MIEPYIKELLRKDIEQRERVAKAIKKMRHRQLTIVIVGIAIFLMFLINYFKVSTQIKKQDETLQTVTRALIQGAELMNQNAKVMKLQDSVIRDLKNQHDILKK